MLFQDKDFKNLKGKILANVDMRRYTTMRINSKVALLYQPDSLSSLIDCLMLCEKKRASFVIIGSGSNVIIREPCPNSIFIKLSLPYFKSIKICGTEIACGAGVLSNMLCHAAEENSLSGSEFLVGIPGTVGGAIIQNAGAHGSDTAGILKNIKCIDRKGKVVTLDRKTIKFGYRKSMLDKFVIVGATFNLEKNKRSNIQNKINMHIHQRLAFQDYSSPSAGCIFKNPKNTDLSAGELIDRSGLKGRRIGDASVSKKHANFIINKGKASAKDILLLISLIKAKVKKSFGVDLEEEVKII